MIEKNKKAYQTLIKSYNGEYSESYCKDNHLFIAYNRDGSLRAKTRNLVNYQKDIVNTDLSFIFGSWQTINPAEGFEDTKNTAVTRLQEILDDNDWERKKFEIVQQGLLLGVTAIRIGRNEKDAVKFAKVDLTESELEPVYDGDDIIGWRLRTERHSKRIIEHFLHDRYIRYVNGKEDIDIPNQYGEPWLIVIANRPDISTDDWVGISEWEDIRVIVDDINATLSRIAAIEDYYAIPRLLITGASEADLKKDDNFFFVDDPSGKIEFLEFTGAAFPSILEKLKLLIATLKDRCPELIMNDLGDLSGYALKLKLEKLQKKIGQLRQNYFAGFAQLFALIYEMDTNTKMGFDIVAEDVIPHDTTALMTEMLTLQQAGVISMQTATEELGYNYKQEQERMRDEGPYLGLPSQ